MNQTHTIIILLLAANLTATIWFGTQQNLSPPPGVVQSTEQHTLPNSISSGIKQDYLNRFTVAFNGRDMDALYNMFGPAAKAQLSREVVEGQFTKLIELFNRIEGGAFTHSRLVNKQGSSSVFVLYYAVRFPEGGDFSTRGTLKITLAIDGDDIQIYGIHLNSGHNV